MTHSTHEGKGIVLFDDCARCDQHATGVIPLAQLDNDNLRDLAILADAVKKKEVQWSDISSLDSLAQTQLRLMARIVFASGIDEETAR